MPKNKPRMENTTDDKIYRLAFKKFPRSTRMKTSKAKLEKVVNAPKTPTRKKARHSAPIFIFKFINS